MVSTVKFLEFFDPVSVKAPVHIVGCGAIGYTHAENHFRLGIYKLHFWDFVTVEVKNKANQMYRFVDINKTKLEALAGMLKDIDPDAELTVHDKGYNGEILSGYVFMAVDSMKIRQLIRDENLFNPNILAMFDFRMRLSDAQHYAGDWKNKKSQKMFCDSMNFTDEEAKADTPVSACGTTLSVLPTVREIVASGVANFINFLKTGKLKRCILIDAFAFEVVALD